MHADKQFRKELMSLAIPFALQWLLNALVGASDALMLGRLTQESIAAVSLANQVSFVLSLFIGAIVGAIGVLVAQYYGKGDFDTVRNLLSMALRYVLVLTVIFFLLAFFLPEHLMTVFTDEQDLIAIGASYLRIVSFSYLFQGASQCYLMLMKVDGRAKVSVWISAVTVVVHYNEYQNRVMGSAIPHVAALEDKFVKTPFESVGIDTLSIEMEESSNTDGDFEGVCYIPSGATGKFSVSDTTSFFTSVLDIAADVPWFGLGASAVSAICEIVNDNKTRCTVVDNMNIVSASYDFKELKGTDMDKCGISIIAGMGPFREGMNNPIARFNARANASYILRMRAPTSGFDVLEYYDANQASVACAMTLT